MSSASKVHTGAANWLPNAGPKPLANESAVVGRAAVPPLPTRVHIPEKLYRESSNPDTFVGSGHFNFIADTLARGQLPNYSAMWKSGEVFAVQDVTGALMNASVRAALAAAVEQRSGGKVRLVESTPDELGGVPIAGEAAHLAIERPGARVPFAIVEEGFEPHRRGR